jgi:hypothetical protein
MAVTKILHPERHQSRHARRYHLDQLSGCDVSVADRWCLKIGRDSQLRGTTKVVLT